MTQPVRQNAYLVSNATGTIFPTVIFARAPAVSDFDFPVTQRWIDTTAGNTEWFLLGFTSSNGVVSPNWVQLASGSQTTETLSGNTGEAVGPDDNFNINVIGDTSGIQFAGNPSDHTLTASLANIPNSSLANSSITMVAGTGISITTSPVSLGGSTTISTANIPNSSLQHSSITLTAGTGITISTSPVSLGGSTTIATIAFDTINVQVITTTGTYTPTAGMKYCTVEIVGGGGGAGGVEAGSSNYSSSAGAGGGAVSRGFFSAGTIGVSQSVTIGAGGSGGAAGAANNGSAGGQTSFGSLMTAPGGLGSPGGHSLAAIKVNGPANGGSAGTGGFFNISGQAGSPGFLFPTSTASPASGGSGANSLYGSGGIMVIPGASSDQTGSNATGYGAGGGGGASSQGSSGAAGGNGSPGICIVTEFISA